MFRVGKEPGSLLGKEAQLWQRQWCAGASLHQLWERTLHSSSQFCLQWHPTDSLKLAMVGVFIPWELTSYITGLKKKEMRADCSTFTSTTQHNGPIKAELGCWVSNQTHLRVEWCLSKWQFKCQKIKNREKIFFIRKTTSQRSHTRSIHINCSIISFFALKKKERERETIKSMHGWLRTVESCKFLWCKGIKELCK